MHLCTSMHPLSLPIVWLAALRRKVTQLHTFVSLFICECPALFLQLSSADVGPADPILIAMVSS